MLLLAGRMITVFLAKVARPINRKLLTILRRTKVVS